MYGSPGDMLVRIWVTCAALTMIYLPSTSVRKIYTDRSTGEISIIPFLTLLTNSHVWMMYGYMCKTWFPSFPVFLIGDIAASCYLFIYWRYSTEQQHTARKIGAVVAFLVLPSTYVIVGGLGYTDQTRAEVGETEGYICAFIVVMLHVVMLKNLVHVIKSRSVASLNVHSLIVGTANTYGWFTYGLITSNWIVSGPHIFVVILHTSALIIYGMLRPSTSSDVVTFRCYVCHQ
ncbi:MtN3-like protein [Phytophthora megakarya]|uniref:MtN3-like protein n=1 Tax=Phytophthora megakarya TaxID=4795 RepID=A0A225UWU8_9STRA|nr:MtN3-like protein [Phytophthora megakarya]